MAYEKYRKDELEPEDAMHKAQSLLINYNTPLESNLFRLVDRIGMIPFARYSVRSLPAFSRAWNDRPVDTAITLIVSGFLELGSRVIGLGDFFGPSIYNDAPTSLFEKITDPFRTTTDLRNMFRHAPFLDLFM